VLLKKKIYFKFLESHVVNYLIATGAIAAGIVGIIYFNRNRPDDKDSNLSSLNFYEGFLGSIFMSVCGVLYLLQLLGVIESPTI